MENIKISVIMSVYNEEEVWLREAIESILRQSFEDFEFIIILDNPKNIKLENIILNYKENDKRIRFIKNPENLGLIKSLNLALQIAKGKYIARMDADDISQDNRLEVQYNFMEKYEDIALIGSSIVQINENGEIIDYNWKVSTNSFAIKKYLKYTNVIVHPTYFFRRNILLNGINNYRNVPCCEDYDFVCRVVAKGYNINNIDEKLLRYRIRKTSISRDKTLEQLYNSNYIRKIYRKNLKTQKDFYDEKKLFNEEKISINQKRSFEKSEQLKEMANKLTQENYKMKGKIKFLQSKICSKYSFFNAINTTIYKFLLKKNG